MHTVQFNHTHRLRQYWKISLLLHTIDLLAIIYILLLVSLYTVSTSQYYHIQLVSSIVSYHTYIFIYSSTSLVYIHHINISYSIYSSYNIVIIIHITAVLDIRYTYTIHEYLHQNTTNEYIPIKDNTITHEVYIPIRDTTSTYNKYIHYKVISDTSNRYSLQQLDRHIIHDRDILVLRYNIQ